MIASLAESATLGGLIHRSDEIARVARWLRPTDFADSWNADLYRCLTSLHASRQTAAAADLPAAFVAAVGPRRADLPRLADLICAAPLHPQPVSYARVVLAESIRREVACYPLVLRAGAVAAGLRCDPGELRSASGLVRRWAAVARARLADAAVGESPGDARVPRPQDRGTQRHRILLNADRYLATHSMPDALDRAAAEQRLVGALIRDGGSVGCWLPDPVELRDADAARALAALRELEQRRVPIDIVTLSLELAPRLDADAGEIAAQLGQWVDAASAVSRVDLLRPVALAVAGDSVDGLARGIAGATERRADVGELLDQLGAGLARLDGIAQQVADLRHTSERAAAPVVNLADRRNHPVERPSLGVG